jgi:MFS superfamily sulfate permease-like transporter
LTGVLIGLGLSIIKVIYRTTHLRMDVKYDAPQRRADIWFDGAMTFMRLPQIASLLEDIPRGTVVHVHLDQVYYVDHTCLDLLKSWSQQQAESGGAVDMCWDSLQERYQLPGGKAGPGEAARASANAGAGALVS